MRVPDHDRLRVALLHSRPVHGDVAANLEWILREASLAADAGARLIVTAEMALTGYGFDSPEQVEPHARTLRSAEVRALCRLSAERGVYCVLGLPERDQRTGLLHNTAVATGPQGRVVARHRKVVLAERRWATPGPARSTGLFDTPWGRVGMLICADTYYGTPARAQVLRGADLLVVPSTWPGGGVDPRLLWRARALENGVPVLACNRTGQDVVLDCTRTRTYAVDPHGRVLLDRSSPEATTFLVDLPVRERAPRDHGGPGDHGGPRGLGDGNLAGPRRPESWRSLGLETNGPHPEYLWGRPPRGTVQVRAGAPQDGAEGWETRQGHTVIQVLPCGTGTGLPGPVGPVGIGDRAPTGDRVPAGGRVLISADSLGPYLASAEGLERLGERPVLHRTLEQVRVAVTTPRYLAHPEAAAALARQGCDLVAVLADRLDPRQWALLATRCLERVPVAIVTPTAAGIFVPPEGHEPWRSEVRRTPGQVQIDLDVAALRRRSLFDRLDLEALCAPSAT
ncbi:MAG: carbon-nitrogen hydrolase family protein [Actinomycetota bacterium]|nr:carbon-nitrogen hydrolase family protein [Actinomycetota bacterium]